MGSVLKTLLGLYLFIWTIIGVLVIVGGFLLASQLPDLKASLSTATQALGGLDSGQNPSDNISQTPANITPEMQACIEKALGKSTLEQLRSQNGQPTPEQLQAFEKCGFTPNQPGGEPEAGQTGQGGVRNPSTPPNDAQAGFPPDN